jgi:hypothetical protein
VLISTHFLGVLNFVENVIENVKKNAKRSVENDVLIKIHLKLRSIEGFVFYFSQIT